MCALVTGVQTCALPIYADLAPYLRELSVGAEQEGRALDPHIGSAVVRLFDPGAKGFAHRPILVRGEPHGEPIFVAEFAQLLRCIARHRDDMRAEMREIGRKPREILRLDGAAGRIGLRIEIAEPRRRSDARRVGNECVRTCRSSGWPYH